MDYLSVALGNQSRVKGISTLSSKHAEMYSAFNFPILGLNFMNQKLNRPNRDLFKDLVCYHIT